jgi:DNA repair ATPase RecN
MTHITKCKVENILGVKKVELQPPQKGVTIGGANGSGKSSAIWALTMALGGREQIPEKPVRDGAEKGEVVVELDEFVVKMLVGKDRKSTLTVENKDGLKFQAPQQMLNKLFGGLSFDPGAFRLMDGKKQADVLKQIGKIDFSDLDANYAKAYEERRDMGRKVKELEGKLAGQKLHEGVPEEEQDPNEIMGEWKALCEINKAAEERGREIRLLNEKYARLGNDSALKLQDIAAIMAEIERLHEKARAIQAAVDETTATRDKIAAEAGQLETLLKADRDEIEANKQKAEALYKQLSEVDVINRKVRENKKLIELKKEWRAAKENQDGLSARLERIEAKKKAMLAEAPFPIEGLSFVEGGVAVGGVPFEQLSESQQWEISLAIGFALNPRGIMFMRNSGGMDARTRARLRKRAEALGVQLFLEVVDDQADAQIIIEEGVVVADRTLETREGENANC